MNIGPRAAGVALTTVLLIFGPVIHGRESGPSLEAENSIDFSEVVRIKISYFKSRCEAKKYYAQAVAVSAEVARTTAAALMESTRAQDIVERLDKDIAALKSWKLAVTTVGDEDLASSYREASSLCKVNAGLVSKYARIAEKEADLSPEERLKKIQAYARAGTLNYKEANRAVKLGNEAQRKANLLDKQADQLSANRHLWADPTTNVFKLRPDR